jgi:hypothetical protein
MTLTARHLATILAVALTLTAAPRQPNVHAQGDAAV